MDIVDSQVHLFLSADAAEALAAMNALGIQSVISDEFWGYTADGKHPLPCLELPDGIHRPIAPGSQMAAMRNPERFGYMLRLDHRDPDLRAVARLAAADKGCKAFRVEARSAEELTAFARGDYKEVFAAAADCGRPVFVLSPEHAPLVERYLRDVPECKIGIDHIGISRTAAAFEELLQLATYGNAYVKWCHPHRSFESTYPFAPAIAGLKRAIDAFGARRIVWASDFTAIRTGERWADFLFYLRDSHEISESDKTWILGRSIRELTGWAAPHKLASPQLHRH